MSGESYLRKEHTNEVFVWTPILAKRNDMLPVSEEEAKELQEAFKAEQLDKVARRRRGEEDVDGTAPVPEKAISEMSKEELIKIAKEKKVYFRSNWEVEKLREKVAAAIKDEQEAADKE